MASPHGSAYRRNMRSPVSDGDAVSACRDLLVERQVPSDHTWRSTVVPRNAEPGWVVRVWLHTPDHERRPIGGADYVFEALPDGDAASGLRLRQLYPAATNAAVRRWVCR